MLGCSVFSVVTEWARVFWILRARAKMADYVEESGSNFQDTCQDDCFVVHVRDLLSRTKSLNLKAVTGSRVAALALDALLRYA